MTLAVNPSAKVRSAGAPENVVLAILSGAFLNGYFKPVSDWTYGLFSNAEFGLPVSLLDVLVIAVAVSLIRPAGLQAPKAGPFPEGRGSDPTLARSSCGSGDPDAKQRCLVGRGRGICLLAVDTASPSRKGRLRASGRPRTRAALEHRLHQMVRPAARRRRRSARCSSPFRRVPGRDA